LAALGIVYGDIGTSPLYALRECFFGTEPVAVTPENILGVLSLIFWALIVVISVKYLILIMRADNNGEGGILALLALLDPWHSKSVRRRTVLIAVGVFGAALLYGDGMITPAISVLSAVEGLRVTEPALEHYVIPITITILVALFLLQQRGTEKVGSLFGPIMIIWFGTLAALGVFGIVSDPSVLRAINPEHAVRFLAENHGTGFLVLGGVFLAVTGGEALYADMGHFGPLPIRLAWFTVVLPALLLNYFGQAAEVLRRPAEATQPFFHLAPHWARIPLLLLATLATVIASQAVISGAFSLTRQAIQLGESPRMAITQTSPEEMGQIYIPAVNWVLMFATIALVLGFKSSSNLAAAYGIAVSTTMVITTVLAFYAMRDIWHWPLAVAAGVAGSFLLVDVAFFAANLLKIAEGGWFPITVGIIICFLMMTWSKGQDLLRSRRGVTENLEAFLDRIEATPPFRIPGTGVFLTGPTEHVSPILLHHLEHNQVLQEQVLLLTVITEEIPRVPTSRRLSIEKLRAGFYRVYVHYGFMQSPNIPVALRLCADFGLIVDLEAENTVYYVGRAHLIPTDKVPGMMLWREKLFAFMSRNALHATAFYQIPPERVVELGVQVEI